MDGRRFDDLLRSLTDSRRSLLGGSLAAVGGLLGFTATDAKKKKKKKPCKKKCQDGCCTKKFGKCIKPAQQTPTQCGTGGAICSTNCGGANCGTTCPTCCAGGECVDVEQISNEQCGVGGQDCIACPPEQICNAPDEGCCAPVNATCDNANDCCENTLAGQLLCEESRCCIATATTAGGGLCTGDGDCCEEDDVCDVAQCRRPEGASCQPGDLLCETPFTCNGEGFCDFPEGCTQEQDDACQASFPNGGCTTACGAPCCVGHVECASSCEAATTCLDAACTPI